VVDAEGNCSESRRIPAQVAITWILTRPFISSVIIGANKMQHLENNGAVELKLTTSEVEKLDALTHPQPLYPGWMHIDTKVKAALDPSGVIDACLH